MYRSIALSFAASLVLFGATPSSAGAAAKTVSAPCDGGKAVEYVEKTICVPEWVEEIRTVKET